MIRFTGSKVTFTEYPGKTSLTIQISGCPFRCDGCHSPELRDDVGVVLTPTTLHKLILYNNFCKQLDAVCFLGCGGRYNSFDELFKVVKEYNLETVLYTGNNHEFLESDHVNRWVEQKLIDAIKTGPYVESLGGLDSVNTNQRLTHFTLGDLTTKFRI